jgi:hypothetical protein
MKGACQAKTSPTLAITSFFFDRQPSTYPLATLAPSRASDLLTHAHQEPTDVCS